VTETDNFITSQKHVAKADIIRFALIMNKEMITAWPLSNHSEIPWYFHDSARGTPAGCGYPCHACTTVNGYCAKFYSDL